MRQPYIDSATALSDTLFLSFNQNYYMLLISYILLKKFSSLLKV